MSEQGLASKPLRHGTCGAYERHGCRCEPCRTAHNARVARNRADRRARGAFNHGTRSAYDSGCRCERCKYARRLSYLLLPSEYPQKRGIRPGGASGGIS